MHKVKITVIIFLILVYIISAITGETYGTSADTPFWQHLVYMFFHANLLHLVINCYSLWFVIHNRIYNISLQLGIMYLIAILSSIIIVTEVPTIGASAMVMGGVGISMSVNRSFQTWFVIVAILISGYFMKCVNADIHVVSFAIGLVVTKIYTQLKRLTDDYRAVNRR